jgi:hypothetical protein
VVYCNVALSAQCDEKLWHRRFGHLNMHGLHAQHDHGAPTTPTLPSSVKVSFDSYLLHKASVAPRNSSACPKPQRSLMNLSSDIRGHVSLPSPHGFRYCIPVIDHHINYMWVRFQKSKDDTRAELESILLEIRHMHARCPLRPVPSHMFWNSTLTRFSSLPCPSNVRSVGCRCAMLGPIRPPHAR